MNFNFQRHVRIAGCVALFIGVYLNNWSLVLFGNIVVLAGYMWTVAKVELFIEGLDKKIEDAEDK